MRFLSATFLGIFLAAGVRAEDPKPILYEAETGKWRGDAEVKSDEKAREGQYVTQPKAYLPLMRIPVPEQGDSFKVWVRVRGYGVCLKSIADDKSQTELKWIYGVPATWTWVSFGNFPREKLQNEILIIRGPGDDASAGLDAVILAPAPDFDPNSLSEEELKNLATP